MSKTTKDGLTIYDLEPLSSELLVVAGPAGYDVSKIDADNLPAGFRWVDNDEWASLQVLSEADVIAELEELGETGWAKIAAGDLYVQREENSDWRNAGEVEDEDKAQQAIDNFFAR